MSGKPTKIELLAPAKDFLAAKAAIDWGADAVYIGAPRFGARHTAGNTIDDIARLVEYARPFGVRVYATLNTLLFDNELAEAERIARQLIAVGVDALIVQDMAYLEMGLDGVEMHASTQTFNAEPQHVGFLEKAGFSRVILERGLSLEQIKEIRSATEVDLEYFVHGAICVGYSGRCFLSRSMSTRSGNRGDCSQACRQTWDLVDEQGNKILRNKYLLSVKDFDLSDRLGDLLDAGVTSFKIEGRLKDEAYVKNTVGYYRQRLDEEIAKRSGLCRASAGVSVMDLEPDLSKSFTRGRSEYYFDGKQKGVASFDTNKSVGEEIGRIVEVGRGWFRLTGDVEVSAGDGICFMVGGELVGTNVNKVEQGRVFPNKEYDLSVGAVVYRNHDNKFETALKRSRTKRVVGVDVVAEVNSAGVKLAYTDADGLSVSVVSDGALEPAKDADKMRASLQEQLPKSGVELFVVNGVALDYDGVSFVPLSVLGALRREGLEKLLAERLSVASYRHYVVSEKEFPYYMNVLDGSANVTNLLAEKFYNRHGVTSIEKGYDLSSDLGGVCVMTTPYCIRREIGQCLKEHPTQKGELYLERGTYRYRLDFDCAKCEMKLIKQ